MANSSIRKKFLDFDARRDPKTKRYCVRCQKDIHEGQPVRVIRMLEGESMILHPADARRDGVAWIVGMDCARIIGIEWTHVYTGTEAAHNDQAN